MKIAKIFLISLIILTVSYAEVSAFDFNFWRHPVIAEKNTFFFDVGIPINFRKPEFRLLPFDVCIDYMLPLPLPFSAGIFFTTPYPNFKSFGIRIGYHLNINSPRMDVYSVYSFNLGFTLENILAKYNDSPPPMQLYDFRIGIRYFFNSWLGLNFESGHKFNSINISISIRIN